MKINRVNIGININDSTTPWTDLILDGKKTIETRNRSTLDSYIGKRVGIIRTGLGKAHLVGFVDIIGKKVYNTLEEFRKDENFHCVKQASEFDFDPSYGGKIGYILENPERLSIPIPVNSKGMVSRKI